MTATATLERVTLPVPILDGPHWRVLIHPAEYIRERIPSIPKLESLVERCGVHWRGWEYPVVDLRPDVSSRESNALSSWGQFGGRNEYWKFYQSGQFIHLFSFDEDEQSRRARGDQRLTQLRQHARPCDVVPSGYVDYLNLLYQLTEVYEFAARLAAAEALGVAAVIEVGMIGVQGRLLVALDPKRHWTSCCPATSDDLQRPAETIGVLDLIGRPSELALDAAIWFYERFGWTRFDRDMLRNDQRKLAARQFS